MAGSSPQDYLKSFSCPQCGAPQEVHGLGMTTTLICSSCGSTIDLTNDSFSILHRAAAITPRLRMQLAIGRRGRLRGVEYEIIGYVEREDSSGLYCWGEYLLLNPYLGFSWLVDQQGHWSLVRSTKVQPTPSGTGMVHQGRSYRHFLTDTAKVSFVMGEFYWQVKVGDVVTTADYVIPPFMLSSETSDEERVWSVGEYLPPPEVASAFKVKNRFRVPEGVAMNQPNHWARHFSSLAPTWLLTLFVAFFVVVIRLRGSQAILNQMFLFAPEANGVVVSERDASGRAVVSDPFDIGPGTNNVAITLSAPIVNRWLAVDFTLVNVVTQGAREQSVEIAYYEGVDGGEAWSEGAQSATAYFSQIPPGAYTLTIEPRGEADNAISRSPLTFTVRVVQNALYWGNLFLVYVVVSILPVACLVASLLFEGRRWQGSDNGHGSDDS